MDLIFLSPFFYYLSLRHSIQQNIPLRIDFLKI